MAGQTEGKPDLRALSPGDRAAARRLWEERFEDPAPFVDWFFSERYCPKTSAGLFLEGRLVSAIHGCPMPLMIRGQRVMAMMVSGVATAIGFERRGYMHRVMGKVAELAREAGCALLFHHPENFATYRSLSQLPGCDCQFGTGRGQSTPDARIPSTEELMDCYHGALRHYSGWVQRDAAAFESRLSDYRACGGRIVPLYRGETLAGYGVLLEDGSAPEALAIEKGDYPALLDLLPLGSRVKLPPDALPHHLPGPRNAYGAADVPALLARFVCRPEITIQVEDPLTKENCGIFNGLGQPVSAAPDYCLSAGELVQGILGYGEIPGLFDPQACYCIEEY